MRLRKVVAAGIAAGLIGGFGTAAAGRPRAQQEARGGAIDELYGPIALLDCRGRVVAYRAGGLAPGAPRWVPPGIRTAKGCAAPAEVGPGRS